MSVLTKSFLSVRQLETNCELGSNEGISEKQLQLKILSALAEYHYSGSAWHNNGDQPLDIELCTRTVLH